jgi:hypothetical protein
MYIDHNIPSMTISMNEVIFHKHRKESSSSDISNDSIHIMLMFFIKIYRMTLYKFLD